MSNYQSHLDICPQCGEFGEMSKRPSSLMCVDCARKFDYYVGEMLEK